MSRLLVLVLPLSILWIVFGLVPSEKDSGAGKESGMRWQSTGAERPFSRDSDHDSRGRSSLGEGAAVRARPFPKGIADTEWQRDDTRELSLEEKVALVKEAIAPRIPVDFSAEEHRQLAAYIEQLAGDENGEGAWLCWDQESSLERAMLYHEVEVLAGMHPGMVGVLANQFLSNEKWGRVASHSGSSIAQGMPTTLTWSIVPDGTRSPGQRGQSSASSDLRAFLGEIYGSLPGFPLEEQPWFAILDEAIQEMAAICGVRFVYEPEDDGVSLSTFSDGALGRRGDIRLAARALDGPSQVLAFAYSPGYGEIVFDSSDTFFNNTGSNSVRLHNVMAHELGHAMGLAHVCPVNGSKLMEPLVSSGIRGPQFDEVQSLQRQYGDPMEHHGEERDNDQLLDATSIRFLVDESLSLDRLSIDDNIDVDYFKFPALRGETLSVSVRPTAQRAYLEGAQNGEDCSDGVLFDPSTVQDLSLEIIAPVGGTVLASSFSEGIGEAESISDFEFPSEGDYFLRIRGGSANAAQIYSMNGFLGESPARAEVAILNSSIVAESGVVKNMRPDPNETLRVTVDIQNTGNLATENLQANLTGPDNLVLFSIEVSSPQIPPGERGKVDLIFALRGECQAEIPLVFELSGEEMDPVALEMNYTLGETLAEEVMREGFDASELLPEGWSRSSTGGGVEWMVSTSDSVEASKTVSVSGVGEIGQSTLTSVQVPLGGEGGVLEFSHQYDMESTWDGCVLEASLNDGPWFDLLESDVEVIAGGYNSSFRSSSTSGFARREAWTGDSGGVIVTTVQLPKEWAEDLVRFRWIIACDDSNASEGWSLDDIVVKTTTAICEDHVPELELTTDQAEVLEGGSFELLVSSTLPLALDTNVSVGASGVANLDDFKGILTGQISAREDSVSIPLQAVADGIPEGDESLVLSAQGGASTSVTIRDSSQYRSWAAGFGISPDSPVSDGDGDGFAEIAEYLLDTDPTDPASRPDLSVRFVDDRVIFPLGELPLRPDAILGAEESMNLKDWNSVEVRRNSEGLEVSGMGVKSFLRLTFSRSD